MDAYDFALFLHRFHISEKFVSWYMHQNALGQPDCMFLISTTSPEKNDEMSFIILIQIQEKIIIMIKVVIEILKDS